MIRNLGFVGVCLLAAGCMEKLQEQTRPTGSIIGKTTDKIGEFDPNKKNQKISNSEVNITNPFTGALEARRPIIERITKFTIEHEVNLFNALEGRYPKDHKEFMDRIIQNTIKLPVLDAQGKFEYQYDVKNHKLVVVENVPAKKKKEG